MFVEFAGAAFDHAITLDNAQDRPEEALAIEKETLAFYIFAIKSGLHGDFEFVATVNLRPAGKSHGHIVCTVLVTFGNQVVLVPQSGTRANNAHGTAKNVEHLREFVEACLTEEAANFRYPLFRVRKFVRRGILRGIGAHGAELVDIKVRLVEANTFLLKKHRSLAIELDGDSDNKHRKRKYHNA